LLASQFGMYTMSVAGSVELVETGRPALVIVISA